MPAMHPVLPLVQVNVLQAQTPQVSVREVPHPTSHVGGAVGSTIQEHAQQSIGIAKDVVC